MKIAQVAPLYESVPPKLYGGTERIVAFLTDELVAKGHDVTLFASGDSESAAKLVPIIPEALRLKESCDDMLAPHIVQLQEVIDRATDFDIIHFHTDYLNFPFTRNLPTAHVTTLHGNLGLSELQLLYDKFSDQPVISISDDQRKPLKQANFIRTVHHGLPVNLFQLSGGDGKYFAFLGRISPEKRCDRAIEIAIGTNTPLKIAAKIDKADEEYFETSIKQYLEHPLIDFIGEINEDQKQQFLGNAKALLFPIDWSEPFGLVMIEAMACGTPVIAWNMGSVPEVIQNGKNGFIVDSVDEAINVAPRLATLDRSLIRTIFEERFSAGRMAEDYLNVYQELIVGRTRSWKSDKNTPFAFRGNKETDRMLF